MISLKVVAEDDAGAMNGFVGEGVWSPVVEVGVPEGFGGDSESLSFEFAVNDLDGDFVSGDFELLDFGPDGFGEFFGDLLCVAEIVLGSFEFVVENLLDDPAGSGRVEDLIWQRLQLVCVSCFGHYVKLSNLK